MKDLRVSRYHFLLEAGHDGLQMPPFKSSAFRGGFGHVFKSLTCTYPGTDCGGCKIQHSCPYIYVFETKPPQDAKVFKKFENVPRPYVISTVFDENKTLYKPGERLGFDLLLYGNAEVYLPYFIHSFELLGNIGLGKQRGKFSLVRVTAYNMMNQTNHLIFDGISKRIRQENVTVSGQTFLDRADQVKGDTVTVSFETPLRIKWQGSYTSDPQFHLLVRNAVRRVTSMLYFHHDGLLMDVDFQSMFKRAEEVELVSNGVKWVDWERYSARQNTKMQLGGMLGEASYRGPIREFVPWLLAGETLRIGKQTAFGLGKIGLVFGE